MTVITLSEAGRAWVFGDGIDTDVLAPGYLMKLPAEELAKHCLTAVDPGFAKQVQPGDIVVAGANFGLGSSREQAAISLKLLGVRAVLATSFARIFYRNALNIGLPALVLAEAQEIAAGDRISVDPVGGTVVNQTRNKTYSVAPIPAHLMTMIDAGGLMPWLKQTLKKGGA
jgi:3-isopropylmalate/(R)-2-methylmalate dehydratase small subunit